MRIHHIRNATFVIESNDKYILIDPMLSDKGELPPFSIIRHKPQKNPTVALPDNAYGILEKTTDCLITHSKTFGIKALQHTDHLDKKGEEFLVSKNTPVVTVKKDAEYLKKYRLNVVASLEFWAKSEYLGGYITAIGAKHGHGWIHKLMANGAGYFIELPNEPSIYICGDTTLTDEVKKAITKLKPDIVVVAAGNASLDVGGSLLMTLDEVVELIKISPKNVIANHMDALNHCGVSRKRLQERLIKENLIDKVFIPDDGESVVFTI